MAEPTAATGDVLLDALANYLQTQDLATIGSDLFVHYMPFEVKRGLLLISNLGGPEVHPYIPNYRRCRFRLIARESAHPAAFALINSIVPALTMARTQLGNVKVKQITNENDPVVFPFSLGSNLLEVSVIFNAVYAIQ